MPNRRVARRGRTSAARTTAILLISLLCVVAVSAVSSALAAGSGSAGMPSPLGASWGSPRAVRTVTATITVPAVACGRHHRGNLGQLLGVELLGKRPGARNGQALPDFSGILVQCSGHRARYLEQFIRANVLTGALTYGAQAYYRPIYSPNPAAVSVAPGDLVRCQIRDLRGGERLTITDLSQPKLRPVTVTGPALRVHVGWRVGMFRRPGLTGPVPSTPALFTNVRAGGRPFGSFGRPFRTRWTGARGKTTATVGAPSRRHSEFTAFTASTPRPWLTHSTTAATASGRVRFQLPGSNRWVNLDSVRELPAGTTIDTRNGHVELSFGLNAHQTQTAVLWGGEFQFKQSADGQTTFVVVGVSPLAIAHTASDAQRKTKNKNKNKKPTTTKKKKQHGSGLGNLWSSSHGNYTTQGNYGAAAVRGTTWLTRNQPNGTYFYVQPNRYDHNDKIVVKVFAPPAHSVILGPGQSLLAPAFTATPQITLGGATETGGRYNVRIGGSYSLTLTSRVRPVYVDAADAPLGPRGRDLAFFPDGTVNGVPRWTIVFQVTPSLASFSTWNVGVQVGSRLLVVPLRLVG